MTRILVALLFFIISACTEKPSGATFLSFSEAGPDGDAYPVRMLVNERFLRIEDGDARDGFIVFDRTSKTIFSVSHPDKTTLVLRSQAVKLDVPKKFVARVLALRRDEPLLRHTDWFEAQYTPGGPPALQWLRPDGAEMHTHDWHDRSDTAFASKITAREPSAHSSAARSRGLMMAFNPTTEARRFNLDGVYVLLLDSTQGDAPYCTVSDTLLVPAHALMVLRQG